MSVKAMAIVFDMELEPEYKLVLLAYADHANHEGGSIFPSVATIVKKTGYSESSIHRYTKALEEKGLLIPDGQGPHGTNKWRMPMEGGVSLTPCQPDRVSQLDTGGVSEKPFRGVTAVTPEPSLTIIEPSVTHAPISKEIFDKANKEVDAILDFERKAQQRKEAGTSWFGRDKLNDQQRLLLDTFVRITGQRPTKDTFSDWLLTSSQWVELEIQPADLVNAYAQSNPTEGKGFTVARPGSLTNVAGMFAGKRRVGGGEVGGTHLDKIMTRLQSSHETFQRPARG